MSGFSDRDLHTRVIQQIQARHNGDIEVSTEHEQKIRFERQNEASVQRQERSQTPTRSTTLTLMYEDHTLGNVLRYFLMARSDVLAAGYVIPHPLEPQMKLHVQSDSDGTHIIESELRKLSGVCRSVSNKIEIAVDRHQPGATSHYVASSS